MDWELTGLNGRAGVLVHLDGQLIAAVDLDTIDGRVSTLRVQLNPAKLTGVRRTPPTVAPEQT